MSKATRIDAVDWRRATPSVLLAAVLLLGGGVAFATIPAADGLITGCYAPKNGALRVIDAAAQECKPSETRLSWNEEGVKGLDGAPGQPGPPGPPGPAGGLTGYEIVRSDQETITLEEYEKVFRAWTTSCPAGKKVLNGGAEVTSSGEPGWTYSLTGLPTADGSGWSVATSLEGNPTVYTVVPFAICATATQ